MLQTTMLNSDKDTVAPVYMYKWKTVVKHHKPIKNTNIIPWKVPLDSKFAKFCSKYDNFYNLDGLLTSLEQEGKKVKMILDLNQSTIYYNSALFKPENRRLILDKYLKKATRQANLLEPWRSETFLDVESEFTQDVVYVKAPLSTASLSEDRSACLKAIFDELDQYVLHIDPTDDDAQKEVKFDHYILVHCFHGINRTGSVLCSYLKYKLGLDIDEAIKQFECARLHKMEYTFTHDVLRTLWTIDESNLTI